MVDLIEGYAKAQAWEQRYKELAEWAYRNEHTLVDALKLVIERLPNHLVSKYERCLDSLPKEKK